MVINDSTSYVKALYDMYRQQDRDSERDREMKKFTMKFTKTRDVKSPLRAHLTDAGIDFFVPDDFAEVTLHSGEDILIDSGIKVIVPEGYALIFKEKSGVATKKKFTLGAAVVDSDYRGVVHFHLFNSGSRSQTISPGDKIVQGLIVPVSLCDIEEMSSEDYDKNETERSAGGFGSTGDR